LVSFADCCTLTLPDTTVFKTGLATLMLLLEKQT
jgi:hypothetical protein